MNKHKKEMERERLLMQERMDEKENQFVMLLAPPAEDGSLLDGTYTHCANKYKESLQVQKLFASELDKLNAVMKKFLYETRFQSIRAVALGHLKQIQKQMNKQTFEY